MEQTSYSLRSSDIVETCRAPEALDFFASVLLTESYKCKYSKIHRAYWALLLNLHKELGKEHRLALGLPRGFAKTTLMKLYCMWVILYAPYFRFILVTSSAQGRAEDFIADIADFLSSDNVTSIWGNWKNSLEKDTQDLKKFSFSGRSVILAALGAEGSVRGLNIKNARPDIIICEDIQKREIALSPTLNDNFINWFAGTLVKARSYSGSQLIYIGNMYNELCLLNKLKKSPEWISFIAPGLLESGESLWPEFRTRQSLLSEYKSDSSIGQASAFLSEIMNDPTSSLSSLFNPGAIPAYPFSETIIPEAAFIVIDPALGLLHGDNTAIVLHQVINGKDVVRKVIAKKLNDTETVEAGLELALKENVALIAVESVAFQATLASYFRRKLESRQLSHISVVGVSTKGMPKSTRVTNFLRKLVASEVLLHPEARAEVLLQASLFNPLRKDNEDDILDACSYGEQVLQEHWQSLYDSVYHMHYESNYTTIMQSARVLPEHVTNPF